MRIAIAVLALAGLGGCEVERSGSADQPAVEALPAALSFDGADYSNEAAKLEHGKRLARVLGCQGCHGDDFTGTNVTADDPKFGDMNAPNLTLLLPAYSDAELERVIRRGVPRDGREFWFMPSESYQFLSNADLAALMAYLRTLKPTGKPMPPVRVGPELRRQVAAGIMANAAGMQVRYRDQGPPELGEEHAYGRRLSRIVCAECHNSGLQGFEGFTPSLDLAGPYSHAELETLLTTGKGKSKPDLGLMTLSAKSRFSMLTPRERSAIIGYIKARAERPQ
jgi:mono/diheme cytochrome c family protein